MTMIDNVTPDELGFALAFLALAMVLIAGTKIVEACQRADREIKVAQWELDHPDGDPHADEEAWARFEAAHTCIPCGGTGKAAEFATTKRGTTKQVGHHGKCRACGGTGAAA